MMWQKSYQLYTVVHIYFLLTLYLQRLITPGSGMYLICKIFFFTYIIPDTISEATQGDFCFLQRAFGH